MKKYNLYISLALMAFAAFFVSCSDSGEWDAYDQSEEKYNFAHSSENCSLDASETSITIQLMRNSKGHEATIPITATINEEYASNFTIPKSVTFAEGSNTAECKIEFDGLEIGVDYKLSLAMDSANVSVAGRQKCNISISLNYNWVSLGKGQFFDGFMFENVYEAEILKADGFERYRVIDPYSEGLVAEEYGNYAGTPCEYIEFYVDEDGYVFYSPFAVGYNYQADPTMPVYAYHPISFSSLQDPSNWTHNVQIDETTFQLAPYYYIDGVGGWNRTQNDGVILIVLPE